MSNTAIIMVAIPFDKNDKMEWIPEDALVHMTLVRDELLTDLDLMIDVGIWGAAAISRAFERKRDEL